MARVSQIALWVEAVPSDGVAAACIAADRIAPDGIGDRDITNVSGIEAAQAESVVFAMEAKTLAMAVASRAGLILVDQKLAHSIRADPRLMVVPDARLAFAQIAAGLADGNNDTEVHPTAVVSGDARMGEGTKIGAGTVIGDGVVIGRACEIGPHVTIYPKTILGDNVHVQAGAVLGSKGFGYARIAHSGEYILFPQQGFLVIEENVDIGANTTIDRGALGETRIGAGSKVDNLVHIGHNCIIGRNVIIAAQTGISGSSVIEDGAILGGQVGIGEHALVGAGVILGGGAGVLSGKKMYGAGRVFWGRPARPLKEYLKDLARLKKK